MRHIVPWYEQFNPNTNLSCTDTYLTSADLCLSLSLTQPLSTPNDACMYVTGEYIIVCSIQPSPSSSQYPRGSHYFWVKK